MLKDCPVIPCIPVSNLGRARRFYEQVIGLVPTCESKVGVTYPGANGSSILMYVSANAGTSKASQAFWQVTDLAAEITELRARGVVFEEYDFPGFPMVNGVATGGGAMSAWFKDTEGNTMALVQPLSAQAEC